MNPGGTPTLAVLGGNLPPSFGTANARTNRCWGRPRHSIQRNQTARNAALPRCLPSSEPVKSPLCVLCASVV